MMFVNTTTPETATAEEGEATVLIWSSVKAPAASSCALQPLCRSLGLAVSQMLIFLFKSFSCTVRSNPIRSEISQFISKTV